jgi:DNA-binding protein HU-beta
MFRHQNRRYLNIVRATGMGGFIRIPPDSSVFCVFEAGRRAQAKLTGASNRWRIGIMNTAELAEAVAASAGLTKADAKKLVDTVFAAIADAAAKGEEVSLSAFGKFKVKESPAREGRNPSTGAPIKIAASRKLTFAAAKSVKDKLNG